jgi:uncharacterized protein YndB with AHSA1/START domain
MSSSGRAASTRSSNISRRETEVPGRHAVLIELEGRSALRFERLLPYPPERVWRALTEPGELADWHPTPFASAPSAGASIAYHGEPGAEPMAPGTVLVCDPPHALAHTWHEDELRWELEPRESGCLLRLTHLFDDRFKAARDGAGWHLCLDALTDSLARKPTPQRGHGERIPAGWSELNDDYQQRFGISPEQATPPPGT